MTDDDFLTSAGEALDFLKTLNTRQYWSSQLPSSADQRIAEFCKLHLVATPLQRQVIVSALSGEVCGLLGSFSTRMAMLSVRQGSEDVLLSGLIALVIQLDWPWTDPRDSAITDLVLIYRSAKKLNLDTDRLFFTAAQVATRQLTRDIVYPPKVKSEDPSLELTGWAETEGPAGLVYYRKGKPIPQGHLEPRSSM